MLVRYAGIYLLILGMLASCSHDARDEKERGDGVYQVVILPHHGITGKNIDAYYSDLKEKYGSFESVVIISPDHYGLGKNAIETLPLGLDRVCYRGTCVTAEGIYPYASGSETGRIFSASGITIEHGIGEHVMRIARYFPEAQVSPLLLRRKLNAGDEDRTIAENILMKKNKRVLIIASVDFSHHVREEFALLHDGKSVEVLSDDDIQAFGSIEVDCRNCLAIIKHIADRIGKPEFILERRTSVETLGNTGSETNNTSHIFGSFEERDDQQGETHGYFLFLGDTHFGRELAKYSESRKGFKERITKILYQEYHALHNPVAKYHRILSGFDDVIMNFESALAEKVDCKLKEKDVLIQTDPIYITWLASLGISMANIANNHSHDCGEEAFWATPEVMGRYGVKAFGYEEEVIRDIRGNRFVFIGIDTLEDNPDLKMITQRITALTSSGYIPIINIHWGIEYDPGHTPRQEKIAHDLIDAGARLIIGHHSHVVGDIEIYKGIPIYYSLGNFLFDQAFDATKRGMMVGCKVSPSQTTCRDTSVYRSPNDYSLSFFPE